MWRRQDYQRREWTSGQVHVVEILESRNGNGPSRVFYRLRWHLTTLGHMLVPEGSILLLWTLDDDECVVVVTPIIEKSSG